MAEVSAYAYGAMFSYVYHQGDVGAFLYIIIQGEAQVLKRNKKYITLNKEVKEIMTQI